MVMSAAKRAQLSATRINRRVWGPASLLVVGAVSLVWSSSAPALTITPTFSTGTDPTVDAAINAAISTIDGLYSNPVTIPVTFTYTPAVDMSGNPTYLGANLEPVYTYTYHQYTTALTADSTANPLNTPLSTAVANLGTGNDANGANNVVIDFGHALMLSQYGLQAPAPGIPTINLNSAWQSTSTPFSFTSSVTNTQYDAIGVLEHELDEVLGGGGAGSLLPEALDSSCTGPSPGPFCNTFGATDLYRYSAPGTPSFTTSSNATAYLSFDGGATSIAGFNQGAAPPAGCPGGDYGDFAPNGTGAGQLIQNACNTTGSYEAYTTSSPEFAMEEAIGWDPAAPAPVPEPGALAMLGTSLLGLVALRRQR
jgi:PEP-CTERM motif